MRQVRKEINSDLLDIAVLPSDTEGTPSKISITEESQVVRSGIIELAQRFAILFCNSPHVDFSSMIGKYNTLSRESIASLAAIAMDDATTSLKSVDDERTYTSDSRLKNSSIESIDVDTSSGRIDIRIKIVSEAGEETDIVLPIFKHN